MRRNRLSKEQLDGMYAAKFGETRSAMNRNFLRTCSIRNILEVGCNVGNQLALLQSQGFGNLYGIEIFDEAVEAAKRHTTNINIIQGSAFDIPFKDGYFDLVFTSGLLIHIAPDDLTAVMSEIHRVSGKYIWGYEYFSETHRSINYRGNDDRLWSGDFAWRYRTLFHDLTLIRESRMSFKEIGLETDKNGKSIDQEMTAAMFLLQKI